MKSSLKQSFMKLVFLAILIGSFSHPCIVSAQLIKPTLNSGFAKIWSRQVEPLVDLNLSPGGHFLGLLTHTGKLAVWDVNSGDPIWSVHGITQHNVVISDTLGLAGVYDGMNRLSPSVNIYGATPPSASNSSTSLQPTTGHKLLKVFLNGAVWRSASSPDGKYFAFGDGARQIAVIGLARSPHPLGTYPVDGIPNDISFTGDSQAIVAGLWNQSGVETIDLYGHILTSYLGPNVRRFDVSVAPTSREVLALAFYNRESLHPVISLLDSNANLEWSYDPGEGASAANAILGDGGQVSYISFIQTVHHPRQAAKTERYLSAIDSTGNLLWNKGGLFVQLKLICLAPDGTGVIAYDDGNLTLYKFGSDGSHQARLVLPAKLQQLYSVSDNRRRLIVYLIDGTLMRIDIS
jgi:hypothetical protein